MLKAADLFCGGGGTSWGAEDTGGVKVDFALNHWDVAIETHSANFPHTRHVNSRLDECSPSECGKIDLLFASPECTHHSRARGGRPTSDQQRAGATDVIKWINFHRPAWVVIENVREFEQWGPVHNSKPLKSGRGKLFEAWINFIRAEGYRVDWRVLNAADFGAATSRERLFVVARKGRKAPRFPEPTHTETPGGELPGMSLPRWRAAAEIIDWSIPCPSIFSRKRPLADKTLLRIDAGLRKFVGPFVSSFHGGTDGSRRNYPICDALPVQDTSNRHGLAVPFQCGAYSRVYDPANALGTVTSKNGKSLIYPFTACYFGTVNCREAGCPLATITTKDRMSLIACELWGAFAAPLPENATPAMAKLLATMSEPGVFDIGFRMLSNPELSAAQGFPAGYFFAGKKEFITRQIGNSVSPPNARALTEAILSA